jgi:hypothetical protein
VATHNIKASNITSAHDKRQQQQQHMHQNNRIMHKVKYNLLRA